MEGKAMKKTIVIATAVGFLALTACQKNYEESVHPQTVSKTLSVSDELWNADTKSVYESGVGIHLTKDENLTVFYSKADANSYTVTAAPGTPDGKGNYSFTHDAIDGAEAYDYIFLLPYNSKNVTSSEGAGQKCRVSPIQYPTATSFDPNMDYLLGQPQKGVGIATSIDNLKFKRLLAPFKLSLTDSNNALEGKKLSAVTFSLSQAATKYSGLVASAYLNVTEDAETSGIKNLQDKGSGNALTALYAEGLAKNGEGYTVWYMMAPISVAAGTELTVSVTAEDRTVTRTVTLPAVEILENKINGVTFDISGTGYSTESSVNWNYSTLTNAKNIANLTGSDGETKGWGNSPANVVDNNNVSTSGLGKDKANSYLQQTFTVNAKTTPEGYIQFTPAAGKTVKKLRVYGSTLAADSKGEIKLVVGGNQVGNNAKLDFVSICTTGGYQDFEVPAGAESIQIAAASTDASYISAVTVFYAE